MLSNPEVTYEHAKSWKTDLDKLKSLAHNIDVSYAIDATTESTG